MSDEELPYNVRSEQRKAAYQVLLPFAETDEDRAVLRKLLILALADEAEWIARDDETFGNPQNGGPSGESEP